MLLENAENIQSTDPVKDMLDKKAGLSLDWAVASKVS